LASDVSWVSGERLKDKIWVKAKIRYQHKEAEALVVPFTPDKVVVTFVEPQRAITPGQSVVFYSRDEVLGGGIIDRVVA